MSEIAAGGVALQLGRRRIGRRPAARSAALHLTLGRLQFLPKLVDLVLQRDALAARHGFVLRLGEARKKGDTEGTGAQPGQQDSLHGVVFFPRRRDGRFSSTAPCPRHDDSRLNP